MTIQISLLELLAIQARCECLSDLKHISRLRRLRLARKLKPLQAKDEEVSDWNEALEYLTGCHQKYTSAEQAKAAVIAALSI